jgi:osmoprotectant transport system ATP-binding protein
LPVVNQQGEPCGVLHFSDLVRGEEQRGENAPVT